MKNHITRFLFAFALLCIISVADAQVDARMLRFPDVSETHITFVYAGDIWVVDKDGGMAQRLSSPLGEESRPRFSPDGSKIAYTAYYDGNPEVYVIPAMGGTPDRITFHPMSDGLVDWYPDSQHLLIGSSRESGRQRYTQFYKINSSGGLAEKLPVPYGGNGSISADMKKIAYNPGGRARQNWKRYEGGDAPDIWIFDLNSLVSQNISDHPATDADPMWHGDNIYFLSDRGKEKRQNIWVYNTGDASLKQLTKFKESDIYYPSIGPNDLVFQSDGNLYLLNLETEKTKEVKVNLSTDLVSVQPRLRSVSDNIQSWNISPDGKRALFEARGDIFTVPAEHGYIRNLTRTSGIAERYPAWSPDGKNVAYWSDRSGEYELCILAGDGSGEEKKLTKLGAGYRYQLYWSPDSKKLVFMDNTQTFRIYDVEQDNVTDVDRLPGLAHFSMGAFRVDWSDDSEWLAYEKFVPNRNSAIFLYRVKDKVIHQVTSGYYGDFSPAFDPEGKYLYFLTNRSFGSLYSDLDQTWIYPNATQIVAASLRDSIPSPLAARNDEVEVKEEKKDEDENGDKKKDDKDDKGDKEKEKEKEEEKEPLKIDLDGFESRVVVLPVTAGNYNNLNAIKGQVLFTKHPRSGTANGKSSIVAYILKDREEKTIIEDVGSYRLSADRKKLLVAQRGSFGIIDPKPDQKIESKLRTNELEAVIDPRAEWHQILTEVWRKYRDYFYDENMHQLDWKAVRAKYDPLVDQCLTRWDLNVILNELVGELNSSHTYIFGPPHERPPSQRFGMLGVNWKLENRAFKIDHIVNGGDWDSEQRSPMMVTGIKVKEGDYVLAVNGIPLDPGKEPWAAFQGLANRTVELTVNDKPSMDSSRKVIVKTMSGETRLRNLEWMEENRKYVDKKSGGKIGYVYMPNTSTLGQLQLVRQFYAQLDKEGIIIDERFNSGGQLSDRFLELITRPRIGYIYSRNGDLENWPSKANFGPKALLINGASASGGDALPWAFKELKAGPLVGTRTGGALIGPATGHSVIDGGGHTVPHGRLMYSDGRWFDEGHGVEPSHRVVADPTELAKGADPQIDKAIDLILEELKQNPPEKMTRPAFQKR
ncbi:MAG: PD40 domain-containing protein [Bacteroidales bacterium]|nr:PD40 domain-containing protein [Bacteroidales bacterium]